MFFHDVHTRIRFVFLVVLCILICIVLRVFYIQVFQYDKLNSLAESLWSRELPITADRGEILDRNGKVLATNITTTSLVIIPNQITNAEEVAKSLSEILNSDYEDMLKHVTKKTSIERVHPEGRQLSYEVASKIDELGFDGVYLVKESKRYYPYGQVLSHVLGYVGIDNQGLSGLELYYDKYLTGENGAIKYFSDGKGNRLELTEVYEEPQNGINLKLTIDLDIQLAAERELDNVMSKYTPEHALIMAMNPKTGEILAMASRPAFDSNDYKSSSIEVINRNLPIWMTYEPGSTFKIMTLAASVQEKTINLFEDDYLLILDKPAGIAVHPSILHYDNSLSNGVKSYFEKIGLRKKIRPVNRLDKDTSGIVIFSKNEYIQECLVRQMSNNIFKKKYIAILEGLLEKVSGTINAPIARKKDSIIERCIDESGDIAISHYKVLQRLSTMTEVEYTLETGRTHQLRVHSAFIGHPIIGDSLYGNESSLISRQALHSYYVEFIHPITKKEMVIRSELPSDICRLLQ